MSKIALQMFTMRDYTQTNEELEKTLKKLRNIGYENIQYTVPDDTDLTKLKSLTESLGMHIISSAFKVEEIKNKISRIDALKAAFGFRYIGIHSMPYSALDSAEAMKRYCDVVNEAGALTKKLGIKLLYHSHAFEFYKIDGQRAIDILEKNTDPEILTLMPDTHWIQSGGADPADYILAHADRIDFLHFKDYAIKKPQEGDKIENVKKIFAPVGRGNLDWKKIIAAAKKANTLYNIVEQDESYGEDVFECVKASYDFMKRMGADE